jgi:predicted lysophospholipase L1 biosynthesis ABC-type transport system permease subunit
MSQHASHEELAHIRGLMDRSTRFLSLSGLSGVIAGVLGLAGAAVARWYMDQHAVVRTDPLSYDGGLLADDYWTHVMVLGEIALTVLVLAMAGAFWFTWRRSRRLVQSLWDASARRMAINLALPLAAGGVFCLALIWHGLPGLVAPALLLFYGLALLNASKYTLDEIRWLGLSEVVLGLLASFWVGAGLLFWALGFGVLHIFYGSLMYLRHERGTTSNNEA